MRLPLCLAFRFASKPFQHFNISILQHFNISGIASELPELHGPLLSPGSDRLSILTLSRPQRRSL
jgi:hypothetical protein